MDALIQYIINEWSTIKQAPLILITIFFVSLIIGYVVSKWRYERVISIMKERFEQLEENQKQNTSEANNELKPKSPGIPPIDKYQEYNVSNSKEFYNNIATCYDQRNSPELLETHREVIKFISNHLNDKTTFKVLDLGGGTGKLIAHHFFDSSAITWAYVDSSPAMVEQFSQNLRNTKLHLDIKVSDILDISGFYPAKTCDVILLSLVLTSMPEMPHFDELSTLLKDDGIFIIADIDPDYTTLHPYYVVSVANRPHALRANRINVSELNKTMIACGLKQSAIKTIKEGNQNYSFVYVFKRS